MNSDTNIPTSSFRPGFTHEAYLRQETYIGAHRRFPHGIPHAVQEQIEHELQLIRRSRVRGVFPDGLRHRALCPQPAHPVPGTRVGGQLRRVLLPGRDRSRSLARQHAVRAIHQQGARRAARYRRRFRASAARRGHPVHLSKVWPRPRGDRGRRLHLSASRRAAGDGQGAGRRPADRRPGREEPSVVRRFARPAATLRRVRARPGERRSSPPGRRLPGRY